MPNENYYAAQKAVRALGTNNVDNAARICHSPSTVALKDTIGAAATTCSYQDWIGSDLIVFIGSNPSNNQPVAMKYLYHAKKAEHPDRDGQRLPRARHGTLLGAVQRRVGPVRHEDHR
ncbi:molybdopterin-dependent oxidoreductase [Nonomuraea ferruginea]